MAHSPSNTVKTLSAPNAISTIYKNIVFVTENDKDAPAILNFTQSDGYDVEIVELGNQFDFIDKTRFSGLISGPKPSNLAIDESIEYSGINMAQLFADIYGGSGGQVPDIANYQTGTGQWNVVDVDLTAESTTSENQGIVQGLKNEALYRYTKDAALNTEIDQIETYLAGGAASAWTDLNGVSLNTFGHHIGTTGIYLNYDTDTNTGTATNVIGALNLVDTQLVKHNQLLTSLWNEIQGADDTAGEYALSAGTAYQGGLFSIGSLTVDDVNTNYLAINDRYIKGRPIHTGTDASVTASAFGTAVQVKGTVNISGTIEKTDSSRDAINILDQELAANEMWTHKLNRYIDDSTSYNSLTGSAGLSWSPPSNVHAAYSALSVGTYTGVPVAGVGHAPYDLLDSIKNLDLNMRHLRYLIDKNLINTAPVIDGDGGTDWIANSDRRSLTQLRNDFDALALTLGDVADYTEDNVFRYLSTGADTFANANTIHGDISEIDRQLEYLTLMTTGVAHASGVHPGTQYSSDVDGDNNSVLADIEKIWDRSQTDADSLKLRLNKIVTDIDADTTIFKPTVNMNMELSNPASGASPVQIYLPGGDSNTFSVAGNVPDRSTGWFGQSSWDKFAVNKAYVDSLLEGLEYQPKVRAVAVANMTLSGNPTVDGVVFGSQQRILLTAQSEEKDNGVWKVAVGAWTRPTDFGAAAQDPPLFGASQIANKAWTWWVEEGTVYANTQWNLSGSASTYNINETPGGSENSAVEIPSAVQIASIGNNFSDGWGTLTSGNQVLLNAGDSMAIPQSAGSAIDVAIRAGSGKVASSTADSLDSATGRNASKNSPNNPIAIHGASATNIGLYFKFDESLELDAHGNLGINLATTSGAEAGTALSYDAASGGLELNLDTNYFEIVGSALTYKTSAPTAGLSLEIEGTQDSVNHTNVLTANLAGYGGRVGIGTHEPSQVLDVQGNALFSTDANNGKVYLGDTNHFIGVIGDNLYLQTSGHNILQSGGTERIRIEATGNVGIGTGSPYGNLDVMSRPGGGAASLYLTRYDGSTLTNTYGIIRFGNRGNDGETATISAIADGAYDSGKLVFSTEATAPGDLEDRMVIDSVGNVGIGTGSPEALLNIALDTPSAVPSYVTSEIGMILSNSSATGDGATLAITTGDTGQAQVIFGDTANSDSGIVGYNNNGDYMWFSVNEATRMTIEATGNVGIGLAEPTTLEDSTTMLEVAGGSTGYGEIRLSSDSGCYMLMEDGGTIIGGMNTQSGKFNLHGSTDRWGQHLTILNTGEVGIGNSAPAVPLHIGDAANHSNTLVRLESLYPDDGSSVGGIQWIDSGTVATGEISTRYDGTMVNMYFGSLYNEDYNSTERMVIRGDGNVGIGVPEPANKLSVAGTIDASKIGIGTTTVPHGGIGKAMLALEGATGSQSGPHIQVTTSESDYPVFQQLNWGHSNVSLNFDCYHDGAWKSSSVDSNFQLYKTTDRLRIEYASGVDVGAALTTVQGLAVLDTGKTHIGLSSTVTAATGILQIKETATSAGYGIDIFNNTETLMGRIWQGSAGFVIEATNLTGSDNYIALQTGGNTVAAGAVPTGGTTRMSIHDSKVKSLVDLQIGDDTGSGAQSLIIKKTEASISDHIALYYGATQVGSIGCEDTTWLRLNQEVVKNIYTPRLIRADAGFSVYNGDPSVEVANISSSGAITGLSGDFGAITGSTGIYSSSLKATAFGITNATSTVKKGYSFFGGPQTGVPQYGMLFTGTAGLGTHGACTETWATYFVSSTTTGRGWIFKAKTTPDSTSGNVASISDTGTATFNGDVIAYASSDSRLKDNQSNIANPLEKLSKLNGIEFDWNDKQTNYSGHDVGVIAQEVEEVLPEIVATREDGYKAVKYEKLVPLLIEAIKAQQLQIDALTSKIEKE